MNKNVLIAVILLIVFGIGATFVLNNNLKNLDSSEEEKKNQISGTPKEDSLIQNIDDSTILEMKELLYQLSGNLEDVTNSIEIRGIKTDGKSTGIAKANYDGSQYLMVATFENLPEPQNNDFYEGWIVRREPFEFISTGKANMVNGVYTNGYKSNEDLTDYNFYVLTLEPNDGNPAPADHILEGTMTE